MPGMNSTSQLHLVDSRVSQSHEFGPLCTRIGTNVRVTHVVTEWRNSVVEEGRKEGWDGKG